MEYKGSLKSIDQYMNLQVLNTEDEQGAHLLEDVGFQWAQICRFKMFKDQVLEQNQCKVGTLAVAAW